MNQLREAFFKGGLFSLAALFLAETILFQVNGTLPISAIATVLVFAVGGCFGLIRQHLVQLNTVFVVKEKASPIVEQRSAYRNSYEEWKRF